MADRVEREALRKIIAACKFESGYSKIATIRGLAEAALALPAEPKMDDEIGDRDIGFMPVATGRVPDHAPEKKTRQERSRGTCLDYEAEIKFIEEIRSGASAMPAPQWIAENATIPETITATYSGENIVYRRVAATPAPSERVIAELSDEKLREIIEAHTTDEVDYYGAADDIMAAICGGVGPFAGHEPQCASFRDLPCTCIAGELAAKHPANQS